MPKDYLPRNPVRIIGWNLISLLFFITLTEVIGGIGYLLGIVGIVLYCRTKSHK